MTKRIYKTWHQIIHETKEGDTFSIKFTKKDGTTREYKKCTIWHPYEGTGQGRFGLSSKDNWEQRRNVMFWCEDVGGYRIANEDRIQEVVIKHKVK